MESQVSIQVADLLAIPIVGVGISLLVDWLKAKLNTSSFGDKSIVVGISVVLGAIYWLVRDTALWQSILGMLGAATMFYAFFLKESKDKKAVDLTDHV